MPHVRIQPSAGSPAARRAVTTGPRSTAPGLGTLHAIVDYAHELADAHHKVLDRLGNLGVRARMGDLYTRFVDALASFERGLEEQESSPSAVTAPRTDVRLREIVGIDGVGADLGLLSELDGRAAFVVARIGEIRGRAMPDEIALPLERLAEIAQDIRGEYEALSA
jgi:hypothetical protein